MIWVGVTGGIGSGKSELCRQMERNGARVLYADDLARKLMQSDSVLTAQIRNTFGDESYLDDGTLNRSWLAKEAFQKGRVDELNDLVHPVVERETKKRMQIAEKEGVDVFVKEAALLLRNGRPPEMDRVILVLANRDTRIERTVKRDHFSPKEVENRMARQPIFEELLHLADEVIVNEGTVADLQSRADSLYKSLLQESRSSSSR
ncbi:MAG: dephospho-CoA kinase [Balneolaceae bacterium]